MTIAVYYRVSTDTQNIGHQKHTIGKWIESQGYDKSDILEFYDEGISGKVGANKRPGFAKLLEKIKSKKITKCVLFEFSRASRDFMQFLQFLELCSTNSCEVEVVGAGVQNFTTSTDKFMASVQAFVAQVEREKISERTRSGLQRAKDNGVILGAPKGHQRNLGWRKTHPEALLEAIQKYTAKGLTTRDIAEILADKYTAKSISSVTVNNIQRRYKFKKPTQKAG